MDHGSCILLPFLGLSELMTMISREKFNQEFDVIKALESIVNMMEQVPSNLLNVE